MLVGYYFVCLVVLVLLTRVSACRLGADNKHPRTEEEPRSSASSNRVDIKLRSLDGDPGMK